MAHSSTAPRRSRSAQLLSTLLFIAAIGFAAAALWVWYTDDSESGPGAPPPAESADDIELATVLNVLEARNDGWEISRNPATGRTDQFDAPGQALKLGDTLLFVFIFSGADADQKIANRETASAEVDLDAMTLTTPSGQVINDGGEPLWKAEHSNVMTILVGGDQALADEVAAALADLP